MKRRSLAEDHERQTDDVEEEMRLVRSLASLGRWEAAAVEWQRVEAMARDGVALAIGAKSEATIARAKRRERDAA